MALIARFAISKFFPISINWDGVGINSNRGIAKKSKTKPLTGKKITFFFFIKDSKL